MSATKTAPAKAQEPQDELLINLYCPSGIQCPIPCTHGPNWAQQKFQDAVLNGQYDSVLGNGGFRSGKTSEAIRIAIELCVRFPGNRVLATRKYTTDVNATLGPDIENAIPPEIIVKRPTAKDPYYLLRTQGEDLSELWVLGLYGTDRKRLGKLKGTNFGAVVVSQSEEIVLDDFNFLQSRLSLIGMGRPIIVLEANPPNVGHWLHTYFEVEKNKHNCIYIEMPTEANRENIPTGYIEKLTEEYKDRPGWLKTYLAGKWGYVVTGEPVFHGFKDQSHIMTRDVRAGHAVYRSWDFGWHHPAVGWYQKTEAGGAHKYKEDMGSNILIRDYAPKIIQLTNDKFPGAAVIDCGDYAGNQKGDKDTMSTIEILKNDFNIEVVSRPNPIIKVRAEVVQKQISLLVNDGPAFTVDPSCRVTIDGLQGGYSMDDTGDVIKDDFFEHQMDETGYFFWNFFHNSSNPTRARARSIAIKSPSYGFGSQMRTAA